MTNTELQPLKMTAARRRGLREMLADLKAGYPTNETLAEIKRIQGLLG